MSYVSSLRRFRDRRQAGDRGAALVELALAVPIFVLLMAAIFDFGDGFRSAEDSSAAVRTAARAAALSGDDRLADFRAIEAIRTTFSVRPDSVSWMTVYRSPATGDGSVPAACRPGGSGEAGVCNVYSGAQLNSFTEVNFNSETCATEPDENWCPTTRAANADDFLGIAIWTSHEPLIGLFSDGQNWEIEEHAVFALYFPDLTPTS